MAKFQQHYAGVDGWSDWTQPVMRGYKLACCDCGLVHDMEFNVLKEIEHRSDGTIVFEEVEGEGWRVEFRARRNDEATAELREADGITVETVETAAKDS